MIRFLLAASLWLLAGPAWAEDIHWKLETLTPGDTTTIEQSRGGRIHHVYRGTRRGQHVVESYRGAKPSGEPVFTTYFDGVGNQLRWVRSDGFTLTYTPHDCTRTLGRCQYRQTGSDGSSEVRLRITRATGTGLAFDEYGADGERLFGGRIALDERGTAGGGRISGTEGNQRLRLIGQVYQ